MSESLLVILEDAIAGRLEKLSHGRLRFSYEDRYREGSTRTPLSLSMPIEIKTHRDQTVSPWLWGLLPDNEAVLRRWAREFQVSASPFQLLSTRVGHDCAGAVRFVKDDEWPETTAGDVTWLSRKEVGAKLRALSADNTAWLGEETTGQFSLAGAQAKTALLLDEGRWGVPSGEVPTTHILKPAIKGFDDQDLNEHLCLAAAAKAGLVVAHSEIESFDGQTAIVVERYDRLKTPDGRLIRIHQEDICQSLRVHPDSKYQSKGGPTPTDVTKLLRESMPPRVATESVWRFADALAWNWLIGGTDAHAKNYSVLLSGPEVRLAPLYDVASMLPYGVHEKKLRLAMKLGDTYDLYTRRNTWPAASQALGLDQDELTTRVRELARAAPDAFAEAAADPQVADLGRPLPGKLVDLITERSARCIKLLDQT